ncbi:hypothetical protein ACFFJX_25005 [Pseudarcicella hirudinis]|uniref:hypothetical protein n=1 Tax=Pseudarcicella hirudinis TaxID=1079859 RepID=UPI0035E9D01E
MPFGKYFAVMVATALKFIGGPLTGVSLGISLIETIISTIAGMMVTVTIVAFLGKKVREIINKYRKVKPKLFNKRSRRAVKIWDRFGLIGIACLTPLFLRLSAELYWLFLLEFQSPKSYSGC